MQGDEEWAFRGDRKPPWTARRGLASVLDRWDEDPGISRNLVLNETLSGHVAQWVPIPEALAPAVHQALAQRGIARLYAHQARAFELASAGRDVVIATP